MLWSEKPIRPSPEIREPEVSGLLLHDLISENLEIMSSQINEGSFCQQAGFLLLLDSTEGMILQTIRI